MPSLGVGRRSVLAVTGLVLAVSGAVVIGFAAIAQTLPQPTPSAGSDGSVPVVSSAEPDPVRQAPGLRDEALTLPPVFPPVAEELDDHVLLPSSEPSFIDIPAIGVRSVIQQVGLTASHTMEVPAPGPHYNEAAWYKHSATPGAAGPAVIVGHVDSVADGPSVFFHLRDLRAGDEVLVTRHDGTVAVFAVDAVHQYPKDDFPTDLVYGGTDYAALRLITCGGTFDRSARSYDDNVVVFATLVGSRQAIPFVQQASLAL